MSDPFYAPEQLPIPDDQAPQYGQAPPSDQPLEPFEPFEPFDSFEYGQPVVYGQSPLYRRIPQEGQEGQEGQVPGAGAGAAGAWSEHGAERGQAQSGVEDSGAYPEASSSKGSVAGKVIAGIGAVVVVLIAVMVVVLSKSSDSTVPSLAGPTGVSSSLNQLGGDPVTTTAASTDYTMGECVNLSGAEKALTVTQVGCSAPNSSGQVVGIVTSGTTGNPTADASLCRPYKYDDDDFEVTGGFADGTGVLYCLSATNGEHDLRYAVAGSCIYRPAGSEVQTYVVSCSNSLANYVTLGVLKNTTSDNACADYSGDSENLFSPIGEVPTYVVCARKK